MLDPAQEPEKFAVLRRARRLWAISPVHGDMARLRALHAFIEPQFAPGDRIVYLGGYLGRGPEVAGTIDELISFRRQILSRPRMFAWPCSRKSSRIGTAPGPICWMAASMAVSIQA